MASQDRTVSIASLMSDPPRVLLTLFGHTEAVLGTHTYSTATASTDAHDRY